MIFTMHENEVSPVMSYENAFHLIKVIERKPSVITPFEEVRDQLHDRYLFHHRREALRAFAAEHRENATIEHVNMDPDGEDEN